MLLEAVVHSSLRSFLREEQTQPIWDHYLTMARIVSRSLRLQSPALIQTGSPVSRYCLSYLTPALLTDTPVILVTPPTVQQRLLEVEIPQLQHALKVDKPIRSGECWDFPENVPGLFLTTPESWLRDRLENLEHFPPKITTLIDQADDLEDWTREQLTSSWTSHNWDRLIQSHPQQADWIRDIRVKLTKAIFSRPTNRYDCYLLEDEEQESLQQLRETLIKQDLGKFWRNWNLEEQTLWTSIVREKGQFTLYRSPLEVSSILKPLWEQQPVVLMGSFLDSDKNATIYRQQLGLGEMLCLKFSPNRQSESIPLYLPARFPLPNTPEFQGFLREQVHQLVSLSSRRERPVIILVEDMPLKAQIGASLAAQFGSRVRVEKTNLAKNEILVSGWQFWYRNQDKFPSPQLLIMATLPIPSLENPLVAGRIAYYKRKRRDSLRLYLLPTALREIQRAVLSLRESQGIVALFDSRINFRSYGQQILTALEPYARINYIDPSWFS